jgi:hypothetical protein
VSGCDVDAALYHPDTKTWELLTAFRRDTNADIWVHSDRTFWTGTELIGWLSGNSGTEIRPDPNPQLFTKQDSRLRG